MQKHTTLSTLSENYDAFLVDLWGVIHDGENPYPGVHEALAQLKAHNKKVIFVSNAPKRKSLAIQGLEAVGVTAELYDDIITSGEITFEHIESAEHGLGEKYYLINGQDDDLLAGSAHEAATNPKDAHFVVVIGFKDHTSTLEEKMPELEECLKRGLPMICANPDTVVVTQDGVPSLCAGVMAHKYEDMGGKVEYFGKPYPSIYQRALSFISGVPTERVACIGDNLATDVKGANDVGLDSIFVPGGIHGQTLDIKHGQLPGDDKLNILLKEYGGQPSGLLSEFVW
jgi:HAD superfamily hydrolase (TIGR01459 family)